MQVLNQCTVLLVSSLLSEYNENFNKPEKKSGHIPHSVSQFAHAPLWVVQW